MTCEIGEECMQQEGGVEHKHVEESTCDCEDCGVQKPSNADKWRYTLYTTVLFLIISSPYTYKLVQSIIGKLIPICNRQGCPTASGLLVHALVFTLVLRVLMSMRI